MLSPLWQAIGNLSPCSAALLRDLIPRVRMAHHAGAGVVPQHAGDAFVCRFRAVADDHHAAVRL